MESSGLDLSKLTLDDIINAMRMNGIRKIDIHTTQSGRKPSDPFKAEVVEWYGAATFITEPPANDPTKSARCSACDLVMGYTREQYGCGCCGLRESS